MAQKKNKQQKKNKEQKKNKQQKKKSYRKTKESTTVHEYDLGTYGDSRLTRAQRKKYKRSSYGDVNVQEDQNDFVAENSKGKENNNQKQKQKRRKKKKSCKKTPIGNQSYSDFGGGDDGGDKPIEV